MCIIFCVEQVRETTTQRKNFEIAYHGCIFDLQLRSEVPKKMEAFQTKASG